MNKPSVVGFVTFMLYAKQDWLDKGKPSMAGRPEPKGHEFHAIDHAKWIASWCQALEQQESWTTKDYAHDMFGGTACDFTTLEGLKRWVEEHVEAECETGNLDDYLENCWEQHS